MDDKVTNYSNPSRGPVSASFSKNFKNCTKIRQYRETSVYPKQRILKSSKPYRLRYQFPWRHLVVVSVWVTSRGILYPVTSRWRTVRSTSGVRNPERNHRWNLHHNLETPDLLTLRSVTRERLEVISLSLRHAPLTMIVTELWTFRHWRQ